MIIHNAAITGSLTLNGIDISDITGSEAGVGALNNFSASILNFTSSTDAKLTALNSFSSSVLSYTSSNDAKITALNAQTASILSYTSSNDAKISAIYTATSSLNASVSALNAQTASLLSYTQSNDARVTGLNAFSSSILSYTSSTDAKIASIYTTTASLNAAVSSLNAATASLYIATSSFSARVGSLEAQSASLLSYTSSTDAKISSVYNATSSLQGSTSSLQAFSASILSYTSSTDAKIASIYSTTSSLNASVASLNSYTQSNDAKISAIYGATSSLQSATASLNASVAGLNTYTSSLNAKTASFATTGSNTFTGKQYISDSTQATSFTQTASFYTDGGVRVTKDMYVSGTAYFNNITVFGTQSVSYISSSQLNIGTNIISVNTDTPSVRFGGLAVYDSGSTGLTGSILWDSQDNQWIYTNPSGSGFDSAAFLVGPRNSGAVGSEVGITTNALAKGDGSHHMTSSVVFDVSGSVGVGTSSPGYKLDVQGTYGQSSTSTQPFVIYGDSGDTNGLFRIQMDSISDSFGTGARTFLGDGGIDLFLGTANSSYTPNNTYVALNHGGEISMGAGSATKHLVINTSGNVGIGTSSPGVKLYVSASDADYATIIKNTNTSGYGLQVLTAGSSTNLAFQVRTNNASTNAFQVLDNGNVGIGTTSPSNNFVVSNIGASGFEVNPTGGVSSGVLLQAYNRSTSAYMAQSYYALSHTFNVGSAGGTRALDITSGGNVGIGTTSPGSRLSIVDGAGAPGKSFEVYYGSGANRPLTMGINRSNGDAWLGFNAYQSTGDVQTFAVNNTAAAIKSGNGILFQVTSSGTAGGTISWVDAMFIANNGNVGIGTTTPRSLFHANSGAVSTPRGSGFTKFFFTDNNASTTYFEIQTPTGSSGDILFSDGASGDYGIVGYDHATDSMRFYTKSAINMFISGSGAVGIGTTSPQNILHTHGTSDGLGYIRITDSVTGATSTDGVRIGYNSGVLRLQNYENGDIQFLTNNTTEAIRIKSDGNVGIGTTNPTSTLQVIGSLAVGAGTAYTNIRFENSASIGGYNGTHTIYPLSVPGSGTAQHLTYFKTNGSPGAQTVHNVSIDGSIGVGTASPIEKLHVNGNIYVASGEVYGATSYSDAAVNKGMSFSGTNLLFNNSGERMRITSGGLVNMGTTSSYTSRLNVQGTSASLPAIKAGFGGVASNGYTILGDNYTLGESLSAIGIDYSSGGLVLGSILAPSTTTQGAFISTQAQFGGFGSAIRLSTSGEILFYRGTQDSVISVGNSKAATVSLFINNSGNVGIGTTNPVSALDVNGRISLSGALFTNVAQTETGAGTLGSGYNFNLNNGSPVHQATGGMAGVWYNTGTIQWYTNSSQTANTTATERMRITNGGTLKMASTTISNNNAVFAAEELGGYKYFQGTLANGEKFGSQGGTYVLGFYFITWFDGASVRGYAMFATTNPTANAGTVLISSGGGTYAVSATYNASNAISLAFDGSSRGAVLSNNTGVGLTFYAYVFGGV